MRLAAHSTSLLNLSFEEGLRYARSLGIEAIEVAFHGFFRNLRYGDPSRLLADQGARDAWLDAFARHDLEVCAYSVHGEPLAPDPAVASEYSRQFREVCELAEKTGVTRLALLAGLPEGAPGDRAPHWVVNLPAEYTPRNPDIVEWQWEERVIPFWREHASIAEAHGCQLCFEMMAWDVVYNPRTLLRLREAIGPVVATNFDPSHLFYQGIDPLEAVRTLGPAIGLVHAKDTRLLHHNIARNGWLDMNPTTPFAERPWSFATVGFGHGALFWSQFIAELRVAGYDDVLSIEHEDDLVGLEEGLAKAAELLRPLLVRQEAMPTFADPTQRPAFYLPDAPGTARSAQAE